MSGGQYRRFLLAYGLLPLRKQPYAGMVKLVNTQDLGDVTLVQFYRPFIRRAHSLVKAGSSCFYRCGSSVTLRLGSLAV